MNDDTSVGLAERIQSQAEIMCKLIVDYGKWEEDLIGHDQSLLEAVMTCSVGRFKRLEIELTELRKRRNAIMQVIFPKCIYHSD